MANIAGTAFDPSRETPLFTAQFTTCAYPISDLYASSPRYLYYALLALVFLTQWHGWLANVFLGAVATYAGTAAIEAFILITHKPTIPDIQSVTIPYISSNSVQNSTKLSTLQNLVIDAGEIPIAPAALELDVDAILAITVTGWLMMLPMHCWSSVVRRSRARHLLMGIWNLLMLAGTGVSLALWAELYDVPLQFRFCYPDYPDDDSVTSDDNKLPSGVWQGDWNTTVWNTWENVGIAFSLDDNCLYPCFNTSQILRRPNSLVASLTGSLRSPRTDYRLSDQKFNELIRLQVLMYVAIGVSALIALLLLMFTFTPKITRFTRVPIHRPKELLWNARKELAHALWTDLKCGSLLVYWSVRRPRKAVRVFQEKPSNERLRHFWHACRFLVDITALLLLLAAMVIVPGTIIVFIVFIEWYIHRDIVSSEAPSQVGQWTSSVSIALVLVSALVLRLKYWIASRAEVENEVEETRKHLEELEALAEEKRVRETNRAEKKTLRNGNHGRGVGDGRGRLKGLLGEKNG